MTPSGYVYLTPQKAQGILSGETVLGNAGTSDTLTEILAEELLPQQVIHINIEDGIIHALTDICYEMEPEQEMEVKMC